MRRLASEPEALAVEVARGASAARAGRMLFLDLDGTLAPIVARPEDVRMPESTVSALRALRRLGWSVVIVTGRRAAEARALVPVPGIRVVGSHGAEGAKGAAARRVPERTRARLGALLEEAVRLASRHAGVRVEVKASGIALHDRSLRGGRFARYRRELRELLAAANGAGLRVQRGRRATEIRPRGIHKGLAIAEASFRGRRRRDPSIVALGDERSDEDLFRALGRRGLSVLVGRDRASTVADRRLASPDAVRRFLMVLAAEEESRR